MFLSQLKSKIRIYSILVAIASISLFDDLVVAGLNLVIIKLLPTANNVNYQKILFMFLTDTIFVPNTIAA
jgi:hypothetical protein